MNDTKDDNSKYQKAEKYIGIIAAVLLVIAVIFSINVLIPSINENSGARNKEKSGHSSSSTQNSRSSTKSSDSESSVRATTSDIEDKVSDECLLMADQKSPKGAKAYTVTGVADSDFNSAGTNKRGNDMYLYRWDGEYNGEDTTYYCYAEYDDTTDSVGIATIDMGAGNTICQNNKYDYDE